MPGSQPCPAYTSMNLGIFSHQLKLFSSKSSSSALLSLDVFPPCFSSCIFIVISAIKDWTSSPQANFCPASPPQCILSATNAHYALMRFFVDTFRPHSHGQQRRRRIASFLLKSEAEKYIRTPQGSSARNVKYPHVDVVQ